MVDENSKAKWTSTGPVLAPQIPFYRRVLKRWSAIIRALTVKSESTRRTENITFRSGSVEN